MKPINIANILPASFALASILTTTRVQADAVTDWNAALDAAQKASGQTSSSQSRSGAIVHAAIFDAAHAFGCSHRGEAIGGFGDAEVFSFHATKCLNSFEGGAIVTNDDALATRLRLMRNFGFEDFDCVTHIGTNGKMTEVCAAMGITSLESWETFQCVYRRNYLQYRQELDAIPGVRLYRYREDVPRNYSYIVLEIGEDAEAVRHLLALGDAVLRVGDGHRHFPHLQFQPADLRNELGGVRHAVLPDVKPSRRGRGHHPEAIVRIRQLHAGGQPREQHARLEAGQALGVELRVRVGDDVADAEAAMQLVERRRLSLDDTVGKWVTDVPDALQPITVRQLLSHQSGIRHYSAEEDDSSKHYPQHYASLRDALAIFTIDPLVHGPGAKMTYSTYGYTLLDVLKAGNPCK